MFSKLFRRKPRYDAKNEVSDLQDGRIALDGGLKLEASLTEATLLTAMANETKSLVHNGVHRSYLLPKTTLNGRKFRPSVYFSDGLITSIQLTWADPDSEGGSAWENFSFERERSIAKANAKWLAGMMGGVGSTTATYTFPWGSIWSGLDERGGFACVFIRYDRPSAH